MKVSFHACTAVVLSSYYLLVLVRYTRRLAFKLGLTLVDIASQEVSYWIDGYFLDKV